MPPKEFKPQLGKRAGAASGADITSLFDVGDVVPAPAETPAMPAEPVTPTAPPEARATTSPPRSRRGRDDQQRPRPRLVSSVETEPAPASDGAGGFAPIFTYLGADAEERLHRAAYARSGEAAKSEIVREALTAAQQQLTQAAADEREALLGEIRLTGADDRSRSSRIYRITPEQKAWLHSLAGVERVSMAATVRWSIIRRLEAIEAGDESA